MISLVFFALAIFSVGMAIYLTNKNWIPIAVACLILSFIATGIVTIGTGKVGVVTQFGKVTGRELDPGVSFKAPFPIQAVQVFDTRIQKEQADAAAASSDLQVVHSTIAVNYHLERGKVSNIFQTVGPEFKERLIDPTIQEAFKATTAQFTASELLTKRPEVKDRAKKVLEERLHERGIFVDDLSIVNFDFSDEFNKAIEAKQVAQQEAEKAQYHLDQARKDAEAQEVQKNSLTQEILTKMFVEKWDGKLPTYMGTNNIFGLPVNK